MKRHMTVSRGLAIGMMLLALLTTISFADVTEDFVRSNNNNIDTQNELDETPQTMENTGFTWGGFADVGTNAIKGRGNNMLFFQSGSVTRNNYVYTIFDSTGTNNADTVVDLSSPDASIKLDLERVDAGEPEFQFLVRTGPGQWFISDSSQQLVEAGVVEFSLAGVTWTPITNGDVVLDPLAGADEDWLQFGDMGLTPDLSAVDGGGIYNIHTIEGQIRLNSIAWKTGIIINEAPSVDAGSDLTVFLADGGVVDVNATITDDAVPDPPATVSIGWTVIEQPEGAIVTFAPSATVEDPQVTFDTEGVYVLRVEADDSQMQATDTVTINVFAQQLETIALTPLDDTFIRSNRVDNTHGSSADLRVRGNGTWTSYLKFKIWAVPGNPVSYTLNLYARDDIVDARVFPATYGPSGEWFEDSLSWGSSDLVNGDVLDSIAPIVKGQIHEFNVNGLLIESSGRATLGLTSTGDGNKDFGSKEAGEGQIPELIVLYNPKQAHHPLTVDGAVEVHPKVVLNWLPGAGSTRDQVFLGPDPNALDLVGTVTVTNGAEGETFDPFGAGELQVGQTYYWQVTGNNGTEGDVWSFTVMALHPDMPRSLTPQDGASDLILPVDLAFTYSTLPDATPDSYNLYISSDLALVEALDASVKIANVQEGYDPDAGIDARGLVDYVPMTTYYYRFEGTDASGGSYANTIKSFSTGFYASVEEFENGLSDAKRGVAWTGDAVEAEVPHSGASSLQLNYASGTSAATATFDRARDWSDVNIETLTLFVRGMASNPEATMSVVLADAAGASATVEGLVNVTDEDPWQALDLSLAEFAIDLGAVKTLSVTVTSTGSGILYIDDIRLYTPLEEAGLLGFLARYPFDLDGRDAGPSMLDLTMYAKGSGSYEIADDTAVGSGSFRIHGSGTNFENGAWAQRPGDDNLDVKTGITVSLWMKEDGTQADAPWAGLFGEGLDNPSYMRLQSFQILRASNNRLRWQCAKGDDPNGTGESRIFYVNGDDGPDTRDGKWHHIVGTYDSNLGYTLYVDGLQRLFVEATGLMNDPSDGVGIVVGAKDHEEVDGQLTGDPIHYFFGWIDEILVYDRPLVPSEVDLIYRQGAIIEGDLDGDGVLD